MATEIKKFRQKALELLEMTETLEAETRHEKRSVHEIIEELEKGLHIFEEKNMREFAEHEHRG